MPTTPSSDPRFYFPHRKAPTTSWQSPQAKREDRQERFEKLNAYVGRRGGWITSLPGDSNIRIEVLPGNDLPAQLTALGFDVIADGQGERIIPDGLVETISIQGSSRVRTVAHAGICAVDRFKFSDD